MHSLLSVESTNYYILTTVIIFGKCLVLFAFFSYILLAHWKWTKVLLSCLLNLMALYVFFMLEHATILLCCSLTSLNRVNIHSSPQFHKVSTVSKVIFGAKERD